MEQLLKDKSEGGIGMWLEVVFSFVFFILPLIGMFGSICIRTQKRETTVKGYGQINNLVRSMNMYTYRALYKVPKVHLVREHIKRIFLPNNLEGGVCSRDGPD